MRKLICYVFAGEPIETEDPYNETDEMGEFEEEEMDEEEVTNDLNSQSISVVRTFKTFSV